MHVPVLLAEILELLRPRPGDSFIDATIDGGGHALAILERMAPDGRLLGIDRDPQMLAALGVKAGALVGQRLKLVHGNFRDISRIATDAGFRAVHGIVMDLGMSSEQLEASGRGFSFLRDEALDMRYDPAETLTAAEIVNSWRRDELERIFQIYGEERHSRRIAEAIVRHRHKSKMYRTLQLVEVINGVVRRTERIHPATRIFQALRIVVNDELESLRTALCEALELLGPGGRLAVISFHSLEDRIVKRAFRVAPTQFRIITKKPVVPSEAEVTVNPRARSAKLRVIEWIED
ncbi:16S rRNA (cytosine(1402)-N(4))-methyltransferase RsmH [Candidatus Parcubacteria bacterium]|nr:16S rRNA (cytosine(1402)-N(4))-methyltransferase RsmH [Candidatus Parcubacteria bacterium]